MDKRSPNEITFFGVVEIIAGVLGSLLLLMYSHATIIDIFFDPSYLTSLGEMAYFIAAFFLPSPLLIWFGIGMIRFKPFARKGNLWLISAYFLMISAFFLILFISGLIYFFMTGEINPNLFAIIGIAITVALFYPFIRFLSSSKVKEQFN